MCFEMPHEDILAKVGLPLYTSEREGGSDRHRGRGREVNITFRRIISGRIIAS